jgi:hypothetical protein
MITNPPDENEIKVVSKLLKDSLWDALYHEDCLRAAHKELAFMKTVIARCAPNLEMRALEEEYKAEGTDDDEEAPPVDIDDFFRKEYFEALGTIQYHEQRIADAHLELAAMKMAVLRGGYQLDFAELEKSQQKRLDELRKREGR